MSLITKGANMLEVKNVKKAFGRKTYWKDGEYVEKDLDDSPEFRNLSELYSKL